MAAWGSSPCQDPMHPSPGLHSKPRQAKPGALCPPPLATGEARRGRAGHMELVPGSRVRIRGAPRMRKALGGMPGSLATCLSVVWSCLWALDHLPAQVPHFQLLRRIKRKLKIRQLPNTASPCKQPPWRRAGCDAGVNRRHHPATGGSLHPGDSAHRRKA